MRFGTGAVLAGLVLMGAAAGARAQEQDPAVRSDDQDEQVQAPRKHIKVLEDPYQISSFYRSRQSHATFFGFDDAVQAPLGRVSDNPYNIAGYYRSRQGGSGYGYSQFWTSGYGSTLRGRRLGYGRRIGANGDLFLIAPTIMAPVGPLTGAFSIDR